MAHRMIQAASAAIVTALWLAAASAHAQNYGPQGWTSPEPNYYATVPGEAGLSQAMYPCPRPTPPLVGQTLITYPPLAPQNMMNVHWTGNGALCAVVAYAAAACAAGVCAAATNVAIRVAILAEIRAAARAAEACVAAEAERRSR